MTNLKTEATDEGTYIITCTFTDSDGSAVTPNSVTWSLTDFDGTTINSRTDVLVTPDTSVSIALSGDDLNYNDGIGRIFSIVGTYDSAAYGVGLPIREQARFTIEQWI